jgi:hypothetical protein
VLQIVVDIVIITSFFFIFPFGKNLTTYTDSVYIDMRFDVLMVIKIQVVVFWVVMPCSDVVEYLHSPCSL